MIDLPRWAGRTMIAIYVWGFISAVIIMGLMMVQWVREWLRRRGGW